MPKETQVELVMRTIAEIRDAAPGWDDAQFERRLKTHILRSVRDFRIAPEKCGWTIKLPGRQSAVPLAGK